MRFNILILTLLAATGLTGQTALQMDELFDHIGDSTGLELSFGQWEQKTLSNATLASWYGSELVQSNDAVFVFNETTQDLVNLRFHRGKWQLGVATSNYNYNDRTLDASLFNAIRHSKRGVVSLAQNHSDLLALQEFSLQPAAEGLVAANKRVANILKNVDSGTLPSVNRALFEAPIEDQLYTEVEKIQSKVIETPEFTSRLALLGELQANIDQYFELVMVNCEDTETRDNRLATLLTLRQLFLSVADFSLLQL